MGDYKKEMQVFDRMKQKDSSLFMIDREKFLRDLPKPYRLYNMDDINRHVGVTVKFWWDGCIGRIHRKDVLDIGGGNSYHTPYWLSEGNRVYLIDISLETLKINRRILNILDLPGKLLQNNAEDICFKKNSFDIINLNLVLHHVKSIPRVLAGARSVMKDDGHLLVVEPNHYFPLRFMYECSFLRRYNPINNFLSRTGNTGRDDKGLAYSRLKRDLREAGFEIEHVFYDRNFFGYAFGYFFPGMKRLLKVIYCMDHVITFFIPRCLTNFIYIIARKKTKGCAG